MAPASSSLSSSTATSTSHPTSQSAPETIIRAYSLRDFLPGFSDRQAVLLNSTGDVTFSTPHEPGINTFSALFSVAAAARGRPGIPPERFGKDGRGRGGGVGEILREGEGEGGGCGGGEDDAGRKVVKCFDEGFTHVKRVYNHIVTKTGEQMDRLLDEALKGAGDGDVSGCASADFRVELEAEEEVAGGDERGFSVPVRAPRRESTRKALASRGKLTVVGKGRVGVVVSDEAATEVPSSSRPVAPSSKTSAASSSTSTSMDQTASSYAEVHLHRFIVLPSIPYYKYLDLSSSSRFQFSDTSSNSSTLPYPTVTFYALRVVQRWLYNPLRIWEVLEEFEPNAHLYLLSNCKRRQDRNGYPPPLATAKGMIEVARAADYLGITELAEWSTKVLRDMCHKLDRCDGASCRIMVPYVLDEIHKSGGMGLDEGLKTEILEHLAVNVESMWKRPVVMLSDRCLKELVQTFKGLHAGCGVPSNGGGGGNGEGKPSKKKKGSGNRGEDDDIVTRPLHWWHLYLELNRVRISVMTSASGNTNRWMEKLLGPTMEHCVHEIARGFNDPRLAADLASRMEDGSFQKDVVEEMLMMVSMSSIFNGGEGGKAGETGVVFEKAPLNRRTVKAVFEGIVNLRKFTSEGGGNEQWAKAERKVLDFLGREWMTIVVGGEGKDGKSGFASWRPAMLTVLSKKLRVSTHDLLGEGDRKGMAMGISSLEGKSRGGTRRVVKDSLGNDVLVDARGLRRTEVGDEEVGGSSAATPPPSRALRPDAEAFVPTGGVMGVDGASD
ncbi:hypothetical protein TWF718_011269 [Orbilia javanica]|uniref:Uncharacterized protein n=1 Tax=Orbilia javanica TaxID=47235 RepID=A0AAN8MN91_9PEZI